MKDDADQVMRDHWRDHAAMRSRLRLALDKLLALYPGAMIHHYDAQWERTRVTRYDLPRAAGLWVEIDLDTRGGILQFAIWKHTGNVYEVGADGAVKDDPLIVVTPL